MAHVLFVNMLLHYHSPLPPGEGNGKPTIMAHVLFVNMLLHYHSPLSPGEGNGKPTKC